MLKSRVSKTRSFFFLEYSAPSPINYFFFGGGGAHKYYIPSAYILMQLK